MSPTVRKARVAGLLYLSMAFPAVFSLMYVPRQLIVRGNASETAGNILASPLLFRAGILSTFVAAILFGFLALALYRLLKEVSQPVAALMLILVLIQIPLTFLNEASSLTALNLVLGGDEMSALDRSQRDVLAMQFLTMHRQGLIVSEVFWGLWLFPFGMLVYRSGFIPRILGIYLIVNGFAYPVLSLTGVLSPRHYSTVLGYTYPALFGELAILLWLIIIGARTGPRRAAASAPAAG